MQITGDANSWTVSHEPRNKRRVSFKSLLQLNVINKSQRFAYLHALRAIFRETVALLAEANAT